MSSRNIIDYTTRAYTNIAIEVKGIDRENKLDNSENSPSPKESSTHNLNSSGIFNKKD